MNVDFKLLVPEFIMAALGFLVLGIDLLVPAYRKNTVGAVIAIAGMVIAAIASILILHDQTGSLYDGLYFVDRYALLFKLVFLVIGIIVTAMSVEYVGKKMRHPGEFYGLLVFSVMGSMMMAAAGELLTAYIAVELLSFSLYVLVSLTRGDRRSAEAGTKYILLGALSSALFLYGISLLYGTMGSTHFRMMAAPLAANFTPTVIAGLAFVLGGLGFKMAMFPFHMWAPDVYEGAPTPITAHLAVISKAAAFALALRFFSEALFLSRLDWQFAVAIFAAATMLVGNLVALAQRNIKRMLAYSSIGQVGYLLMGVVALTPAASTALLFHIVGYAFTTLAAFMVVIAVEMHTGKEEISDYEGLSGRSPLSALVMTVALFSMAGLPIFAGFITKFYLFTSVWGAGLGWLVIVGVTASLISLYYYLQVIRQMYVEHAAGNPPVPVPALATAVLIVTLAGTVLLGIYPAPLVDIIETATRSLGPFATAVLR